MNRSWQEVIARDIQLMLLHLERKATNGSRGVHSLDDVYRSTWLTSGLGGVIVLEDEPGVRPSICGTSSNQRSRLGR